MLSKCLKEKIIIYSICENSGDISAGAVFKAAKIAEVDCCSKQIANKSIICCGDINNNEKMFRTEDGRFYFSISDGWGYDCETLYGLKINFFYDFGHSTTIKSALAECGKRPGYSTWGGAMAFQARKKQLDIIKITIQK